ncbi:MAG: hypothetical protein GC190_19405 [Alphaproteobacteria bacterium]|nr:hypothetical protein [Alphaproteobacteria bacterium]
MARTKTKTAASSAAAIIPKDAKYVVVGCKVPNGLILRTFTPIDVNEPVMGGGTRAAKVSQDDGVRVALRGPATETGKANRVPVIGGYALNRNVPADFMEKWLAQNQGSALVHNRQIIVHEQADSVEAIADEHEDMRSGLEPMAQDGDPRRPRRSNPALSEIQRDDGKERAAA